uniref:SUN domain-containing protein n=1 Tax=Leptobrachium leishanense TaxID=445787 RepID=A0A8C5P775_9ANUR
GRERADVLKRVPARFKTVMCPASLGRVGVGAVGGCRACPNADRAFGRALQLRDHVVPRGRGWGPSGGRACGGIPGGAREGLDDDDPKAGDTTVVQTNGELNSAQTQTTMINGYTCNDCSMISDRNNVLTIVAAAGWFVSRNVLSFLWLAIVSPGKAASGIFWWLGTGWYQLSTLISLLNVFLLTRCLPKMRKLLFLLIPLLLLLGLWFWGIGNLWSLLPAFTGLRTQSGKAAEDPVTSFKPTPDIRVPISNKQDTDFHIANKIQEMEKQLALLASNHSYQVKDHDKLVLLVQQIQEQVTKNGDQSQMYTLISSIWRKTENEDIQARVEQEFATYKAELLKEKPVGEGRVLQDPTVCRAESQTRLMSLIAPSTCGYNMISLRHMWT